MIVGPSYFEGDEDSETKLKQHDVYDEALGIIVSTCNQYTSFARSLLDDTDHPKWSAVNYYDHRALQDAHDLLAAVWRFQNGNDFRQAKLPFEAKNCLDEVRTLWLNWLRNEIAGWITRPHLVRSVQMILMNQNEMPGYVFVGSDLDM